MATKFTFPRKSSANGWGASRYHMIQAVEQSLRRLQTRSHRSPLLPSLGRHHADRRNLARPGRFDSHGQSYLYRRLALCLVATGPRQRARGAQRLDAVYRVAVRIQYAETRCRARSFALLPRPPGRASCPIIPWRAVFLPANTRSAKRHAAGIARRIDAKRSRADGGAQLSDRNAAVRAGRKITAGASMSWPRPGCWRSRKFAR